MIATTVACYHCGADCYEGYIGDGDKSFCCQGCHSVYTLLNDVQLCTYYQLDAHPGQSPDTLALSGKYAWLEDEKLVNGLIEFKRGDRSHVTLSIPSMHCSSCIWLLEHLNRLDPGVIQSTVNFPARTVAIAYRSDETTLRRIVEWMTRIGYEPVFTQGDAAKQSGQQQNRSTYYKIGVAGFCFGNIMMLSLPDYVAPTGFADEVGLHHVFMALSVLLSLPVIGYASSDIFASAWKGLRGKYLNIDLPIALAILVTFLRSLWDWYSGSGTGYFDSMTGIVFFMLVGRFFQQRTWQRLSFDRDYRSYFPVAVMVKKQGKELPTAVSEIKIGDRLVIRNQELIPADAILIKHPMEHPMEHPTMIDYSFVTGESDPIPHQPGDRVYAGGRLQGSASELEVIRPMDQSYLTRLWNNPVFKRAEQTDQTRYVEQINRWFTALTLLISIGSFIYWAPLEITRAMNAATAVLIIACPCALLLAATFTHGNMLRILGLNGFYLRSAQVIERLTEINGIVFDKTGTLTHSKRSELAWHGAELSQEQKAWVHALAIQSIHPYSRLVSRYWTTPHRFMVQSFNEIPGQGLEGEVAGHRLRLGHATFVGATDIPASKEAGLWISMDDRVLGYFTVKQAYRESIPRVIASLRSTYNMAVLSGDREVEAAQLRSMFGDQVPLRFNQSPEQKMKAIQDLQKDQDHWMMIGDGLNDAGALAQSYVGVSVTDDLNRFSPACDAILDGSKLDRLQTFLHYVIKGKHMVTLAFGISLIYNVIGLGYAVFGQLSPVIAAILMPLMSISIVSITTLSTTWLAYRSGLQIQSPTTWEASI